MKTKANSVDVLGVRVDKVTMEETVSLVELWIAGSGKHYIVTTNPEFVMAAQKDKDFKKVLNNADLSIPDGTGLKLGGVKNTVPGVDLMERLCQKAAEKGYTVGFLGGQNGVAKEASNCLSQRYPGLKIVFAEDGPPVSMKGQVIQDTDFKIEGFCDLLFVAFGQVKQEKWISNNIQKLPAKVMMGVGGSFDYLSGRVTRAPRFIRKLGLEWLFRLVLQPWRIKRQLALLKFVFKVCYSGNNDTN